VCALYVCHPDCFFFLPAFFPLYKRTPRGAALGGLLWFDPQWITLLLFFSVLSEPLILRPQALDTRNTTTTTTANNNNNNIGVQALNTSSPFAPSVSGHKLKWRIHRISPFNCKSNLHNFRAPALSASSQTAIFNSSARTTPNPAHQRADGLDPTKQADQNQRKLVSNLEARLNKASGGRLSTSRDPVCSSHSSALRCCCVVPPNMRSPIFPECPLSRPLAPRGITCINSLWSDIAKL